MIAGEKRQEEGWVAEKLMSVVRNHFEASLLWL
jgi:hypothetical protein